MPVEPTDPSEIRDLVYLNERASLPSYTVWNDGFLIVGANGRISNVTSKEQGAIIQVQSGGILNLAYSCVVGEQKSLLGYDFNAVVVSQYKESDSSFKEVLVSSPKYSENYIVKSVVSIDGNSIDYKEYGYTGLQTVKSGYATFRNSVEAGAKQVVSGGIANYTELLNTPTDSNGNPIEYNGELLSAVQNVQSGTANVTTIGDNASQIVGNKGKTNYSIVKNGGTMTVSGIANNTTVESGGTLVLNSGAKLGGVTTLEGTLETRGTTGINGKNATLYLTTLSTDTAKLNYAHVSNLNITINGAILSFGETYKIASNARNFNGSITLVNDSIYNEVGTLSLDKTVYWKGVAYTLSKDSENHLLLAVQSGEPLDYSGPTLSGFKVSSGGVIWGTVGNLISSAEARTVTYSISGSDKTLTVTDPALTTTGLSAVASTGMKTLQVSAEAKDTSLTFTVYEKDSSLPSMTLYTGASAWGHETLHDPDNFPAAGSVSTVYDKTAYFADAEKYNKVPDMSYCWADSASNILTWTGWAAYANKAFAQNEDAVMDYFAANWQNTGGSEVNGFSWFLDGTGVKDDIVPVDGGNLYNGKVTASRYTGEISLANLDGNALSVLTDYLNSGFGITLGVGWEAGEGSTHAITCWGYEGTAGEDDFYLYFSDSDSDYYYQYMNQGVSGNMPITTGVVREDAVNRLAKAKVSYENGNYTFIAVDLKYTGSYLFDFNYLAQFDKLFVGLTESLADARSLTFSEADASGRSEAYRFGNIDANEKKVMLDDDLYKFQVDKKQRVSVRIDNVYKDVDNIEKIEILNARGAVIKSFTVTDMVDFIADANQTYYIRVKGSSVNAKNAVEQIGLDNYIVKVSADGYAYNAENGATPKSVSDFAITKVITLKKGETSNQLQVNSGETLNINGGIAYSTTVSGGILNANSGGSAYDTTFTAGTFTANSGARLYRTNIENGTFTLNRGAVSADTVFTAGIVKLNGGTLGGTTTIHTSNDINSGFTITGDLVANGTDAVLNLKKYFAGEHNITNFSQINVGAVLNLAAGKKISGSNMTITLDNGGIVSGKIIDSGTLLKLNVGAGSALSNSNDNGATEITAVNGTIDLKNAGTISGEIKLNGKAVQLYGSGKVNLTGTEKLSVITKSDLVIENDLTGTDSSSVELNANGKKITLAGTMNVAGGFLVKNANGLLTYTGNNGITLNSGSTLKDVSVRNLTLGKGVSIVGTFDGIDKTGTLSLSDISLAANLRNYARVTANNVVFNASKTFDNLGVLRISGTTSKNLTVNGGIEMVGLEGTLTASTFKAGSLVIGSSAGKLTKSTLYGADLLLSAGSVESLTMRSGNFAVSGGEAITVSQTGGTLTFSGGLLKNLTMNHGTAQLILDGGDTGVLENLTITNGTLSGSWNNKTFAGTLKLYKDARVETVLNGAADSVLQVYGIPTITDNISGFSTLVVNRGATLEMANGKMVSMTGGTKTVTLNGIFKGTLNFSGTANTLAVGRNCFTEGSILLADDNTVLTLKGAANLGANVTLDTGKAILYMDAPDVDAWLAGHAGVTGNVLGFKAEIVDSETSLENYKKDGVYQLSPNASTSTDLLLKRLADGTHADLSGETISITTDPVKKGRTVFEDGYTLKTTDNNGVMDIQNAKNRILRAQTLNVDAAGSFTLATDGTVIIDVLNRTDVSGATTYLTTRETGLLQIGTYHGESQNLYLTNKGKTSGGTYYSASLDISNSGVIENAEFRASANANFTNKMYEKGKHPEGVLKNSKLYSENILSVINKGTIGGGVLLMGNTVILDSMQDDRTVGKISLGNNETFTVESTGVGSVFTLSGIVTGTATSRIHLSADENSGTIFLGKTGDAALNGYKGRFVVKGNLFSLNGQTGVSLEDSEVSTLSYGMDETTRNAKNLNLFSGTFGNIDASNIAGVSTLNLGDSGKSSGVISLGIVTGVNNVNINKSVSFAENTPISMSEADRLTIAAGALVSSGLYIENVEIGENGERSKPLLIIANGGTLSGNISISADRINFAKNGSGGTIQVSEFSVNSTQDLILQNNVLTGSGTVKLTSEGDVTVVYGTVKEVIGKNNVKEPSYSGIFDIVAEDAYFDGNTVTVNSGVTVYGGGKTVARASSNLTVTDGGSMPGSVLDVYGGGLKNVTIANVTIAGTVTGDVYAGGAKGTTVTTANVTMKKVDFTGEVYGKAQADTEMGTVKKANLIFVSRDTDQSFGGTYYGFDSISFCLPTPLSSLTLPFIVSSQLREVDMSKVQYNIKTYSKARGNFGDYLLMKMDGDSIINPLNVTITVTNGKTYNFKEKNGVYVYEDSTNFQKYTLNTNKNGYFSVTAEGMEINKTVKNKESISVYGEDTVGTLIVEAGGSISVGGTPEIKGSISLQTGSKAKIRGSLNGVTFLLDDYGKLDTQSLDVDLSIAPESVLDVNLSILNSSSSAFFCLMTHNSGEGGLSVDNVKIGALPVFMHADIAQDSENGSLWLTVTNTGFELENDTWNGTAVQSVTFGTAKTSVDVAKNEFVGVSTVSGKKGDVIDYFKINVETAGTYSFSINNYSNDLTVKLWKIVNGKISQVKVITVRGTETENLFGDQNLLSGEYAVSIELADKTTSRGKYSSYDLVMNGAANQQITVNAPYEFWQSGPTVTITPTSGALTRTDGKITVTDDAWAGFGLQKSYRNFTVASSGVYSLEISGLSARASITVYEIVTNADGTEKLLQVKASPVIPGNGGGTGSGSLHELLLSGDKRYTVLVNAVDAANSNSNNTGYVLSLFTTTDGGKNGYVSIKADSQDDNWKTLSSAYSLNLLANGGMYDDKNKVIINPGEDSHVITANDSVFAYLFGTGENTVNWVGYGDTVDYQKVTVADSGRYNFSISGLAVGSKVSFTLYENRNGILVKIGGYTSFTATAAVDGMTIQNMLLSSDKEYYLEVKNLNVTASGISTDYKVIAYANDTAVGNPNTYTGTVYAQGYNGDDTWSAASSINLETGVNLFNDPAGTPVEKAGENWVGFGDTADWRVFTLNDPGQAGMYKFTAQSDKLSSQTVSIYRVSKFDADGNPVAVVKVASVNANGEMSVELLAGATYYAAVEAKDKTTDKNNICYTVTAEQSKSYVNQTVSVNSEDGFNKATFTYSKDDYGYSFTLTENAMIAFNVTKGLTVYKDNGFGVMTSIGTIYEWTSEFAKYVSLAAGTYYVKANSRYLTEGESLVVYADNYDMTKVTNNNTWGIAAEIAATGGSPDSFNYSSKLDNNVKDVTWVGFGDASDYYSFMLTGEQAGRYVFTMSDALASGVKMTVYRANYDAAGNIIRVTALGSATANVAGSATYTTGDLLAGTYFVAFDSTNATGTTAGKNSDYSFTVEKSSSGTVYTGLTEMNGVYTLDQSIHNGALINGGRYTFTTDSKNRLAKIDHSKYTVYMNNGSGALKALVVTGGQVALAADTTYYLVAKDLVNNFEIETQAVSANYSTEADAAKFSEQKKSFSQLASGAVSDWIGFKNGTDYVSVNDSFTLTDGGWLKLNLSGRADDKKYDIDTNLTIAVYRKDASGKDITIASGTYKANTVYNSNLYVQGSLAAGENYFVKVSAVNDSGAYNTDYELNAAIIAYTNDNSFFRAYELTTGNSSVQVVSTTGDRYDYYKIAEEGFLRINCASGSIKVSRYDENQILLGSFMLTNGSKESLDMALNGSGYIRIESIGSQGNIYDLSFVEERTGSNFSYAAANSMQQEDVLFCKEIYDIGLDFVSWGGSNVQKWEDPGKTGILA